MLSILEKHCFVNESNVACSMIWHGCGKVIAFKVKDYFGNEY
jgi:hypothetical protein